MRFDITRKIINKFWITVYLLEIQLDDLVKLSFDRQLRFEPLSQNSLDQLKVLYKDEVGQKNIDKMQFTLTNLSSVKCYTLFYGSQIAGYCHISFADIEESRTKYKIDLKNDEAYLFKDYTLKKFRGRKIHLFSIQSRLLICKNLGYKKAFVCIYKNNPYSLRSYTKSGFKIVKRILSIRIISFQKNIIYSIA